MDNSLRSLSFVILFAGLSTITVLGIIGLNNAHAENANMTANMNMSTSMTANQNKTMNNSVNMSANMTGNVNGNMNMTNVQKILSPLQQFKSGTPAKSVQCNKGFTLVIKMEDNSPACVTSQIAQALTARGWGAIP